MTEEETRESETVDIKPFDGKPDKLDRGLEDGSQDDVPADIEEGEPVGGLELEPELKEDSDA